MYVFQFLLCSLPSFIHWLILVTTKNTIFLFIFKGLLIFITHVLMNNKVREKNNFHWIKNRRCLQNLAQIFVFDIMFVT